MHTRLARLAYLDCLQKAGFSPAFADAFLGKSGYENVLFLPFFEQVEAYPWPPFFLPLLQYRHGVEAYGVSLHPLHPARQPAFARLSIETGYVEEVARSETQFLDLIALESSITTDDDVQLDDQAGDLLRRLGREQQLPHILAAAQHTGILEEGLAEHVPGFGTDWPLALYEYRDIFAYTGGFPTSLAMAPACPYEYDFLLAAELVDADGPRAVHGDSPADRWLALQASGTSLSQARDTLSVLKTATDHPLLDAWLLAAEGVNSSY